MIQSIDRAGSILELFKNHKQLDLNEITELIGLSKSTLHTIIKTLEKNRLLKKDTTTKKYQLGYQILELGLKQLSELEINNSAASPLRKLSNDVKKICNLGIWVNNSTLVTMRTEPAFQYPHAYSSIPSDRRKPAYCTSLGKAILAFLPKEDMETYLNEVELLPFTKNTITDKDKLIEELRQIKNQGFSIDRKEYVAYMMSVGAPVHGISGKVAGAISIHSDMDDYDEESLTEFIEPLIRTAYEISANMGYQPIPL